MSSRRYEWQLSVQLLPFLISVLAVASALPAHNVSHGLRDDLTTDFALSIMRRAKAASISASMDTRIAPCNDFFAYACGNWHRNNPAQLFSNVMTDTFQLIQKGFDRRVKQLLEAQQPQTSLERKLQRFYQSCQLVHRDDIHYKLALENAYREYGEMPLLTCGLWDEWSNFTWWRTVAQLQYKYGMEVILAVKVINKDRVYVGSPTYSYTRLLNMQEDSSFARTVKDLQRYLGISTKLAKQTAKEFRELEQKLITGGSKLTKATLQKPTELSPVSTLQPEYAAHIDMGEFLHLALGYKKPKENCFFDKNYVEHTITMLKTTSPSTVANYILWQAVQEYVVDATDADMTKWCLSKTKRYFGKYTDHAVYALYRNERDEAAVLAVWENVRAEFRKQLAGDKLDWIANDTRSSAIQKLESMQLAINSYDDENFDELFGNVPIDGTNYVANVQQLLLAEQNRTRHQLLKSIVTVELTENFRYTPAYNIEENKIRVPVALMQPRYFWDASYPHALKYATLGYLIAHEIIYRFIDEGPLFDEHGNIKLWWDAKSYYEFGERRKCFDAQYHAYTHDGAQMLVHLQQSEIIADNGGIKLAYTAYQRWLQQQPAEIQQQETLSGLQLDNRQLFFVSFAQLWCNDARTLFKSTTNVGDEHAPGMHRVISSLSNFQEFSWVFKCPQDAPMDPEYKCAIY